MAERPISRTSPLNALLAQRLIERSKLGQTLIEQSAEGLRSLILQQLETLLLQVSDMICEMPTIKEIDINPVIISDEGPIVVDARMVVESSTGQRRPRYDHLSIMPFPGHLTQEFPMHSGETYTIRPLRWSDGEHLKRLLASLSDESRYMRFLANIKEYTPKQLARLTQIDYHRDMALAAVVGHGDEETLIGVSRYMLLPDMKTAEFALVVQDNYQGQGLGARLMQSLFDVAREQHLTAIEGLVHGNNSQMLHLMHRLGFTIEVDPDDHSLRRVVKSLVS